MKTLRHEDLQSVQRDKWKRTGKMQHMMTTVKKEEKVVHNPCCKGTFGGNVHVCSFLPVALTDICGWHPLNVYPQKRTHYPLNWRPGRPHNWSGQLRRGCLLSLSGFKLQTIHYIGNCTIAQSWFHGVPGTYDFEKWYCETRRLQQFLNY